MKKLVTGLLAAAALMLSSVVSAYTITGADALDLSITDDGGAYISEGVEAPNSEFMIMYLGGDGGSATIFFDAISDFGDLAAGEVIDIRVLNSGLGTPDKFDAVLRFDSLISSEVSIGLNETGILSVTLTSDLSGPIDWGLDITTNLNQGGMTVVHGSIPEPASLALMGLGLLGLGAVRRRRV